MHPHRARGCFWLPTRPTEICGWEGAGGQVSIGPVGFWSAREARLTRLVLTGLHGVGPSPEDLAAAFPHLLSTAMMRDQMLAYLETGYIN